jgi:hypothetical protein
MKRNEFCVGILMLAAVALAGCKPQPGATMAGEATEEIGPKYSAKSGLFVPEDTRQSLGLKIVEVTEQKIPMILELPLRVYRNNDVSTLASGSATPEQAKVLRAGQLLQMVAGDGTKHDARITNVSEGLQKATGMAEVLVEIPNTSEPLEIGAFLNGSVTVGAEQTVVTIPRSALLECSDGSWVYTVSGDGFVRTAVKAGATNGELVEIKNGLYAGDQVVLQPVMSLWMTELAAVKGGQACCAVPAKGK